MTQNFSQISATETAVPVATGQQERRQGVSPSGAGVCIAPASSGLSARAVAAMEAARSLHPAGAVPASSDRQVIRSELCGSALKMHDNQAISPDLALEASKLQGKLLKDNGKTSRKSRSVQTGGRLAEVLEQFKFDYFEGLLSAPDGTSECRAGGKIERGVIQRACLLLRDAGLRQGFSAKTGRDYGRGLNFHQGDESAAVCFLQSGSTMGATPRLTVKGGHGFCARFVPQLQRADLNFQAIRVDVCLDLLDAGPDAFDKLHDMSVTFARGAKISAPDVVGSEEKGRTFYLKGKGGVLLRVYEKGLEQRGKGNLDAPASWLRIEFQYTGIESGKKVSTARMTPAEVVRHKDFSRKWLERAATLLKLAAAGERAARFVAEYAPKVKTLDDALEHGARQYGRSYSLAAVRDIIDSDFDGDRRAAAAAGALSDEAVVDRAGEIFAGKIGDAAKRVLATTRAGVDESDEAWAEAVAAQQQADYERDLEREVRARKHLRGHVDPVAQNTVNRVELEASQVEAEDALAAVRAA
ncbi:hypothetical protein, partial [Paracoccus sp. (in: a-proteobacteria)]|uniref:hypothetical protein n=1 Tax=Paracoccus sp. TaxID=267 RepID=UPI00321F6B58